MKEPDPPYPYPPNPQIPCVRKADGKLYATIHGVEFEIVAAAEEQPAQETQQAT